MYVRGHRDVTC